MHRDDDYLQIIPASHSDGRYPVVVHVSASHEIENPQLTAESADLLERVVAELSHSVAAVHVQSPQAATGLDDPAHAAVRYAGAAAQYEILELPAPPGYRREA